MIVKVGEKILTIDDALVEDDFYLCSVYPMILDKDEWVLWEKGEQSVCSPNPLG